jgi:hypothetical protein
MVATTTAALALLALAGCGATRTGSRTRPPSTTEVELRLGRQAEIEYRSPLYRSPQRGQLRTVACREETKRHVWFCTMYYKSGLVAWSASAGIRKQTRKAYP